MKQIVFSIVVTLAFGLAALAQTSSTPSTTQSGTQGTSPSTSQGTSGTGSQTPDISAGSQSSSGNQSLNQGSMRGEKKLKGCIESRGGQYVLEEKRGKEVALTGSQDLASHVGHTVTVHGTFENASAGAAAASSNSKDRMPSSPGSTQASNAGAGMGSASATSGESFNVSKIDMVSDTCNLEKHSKNPNTGTTNPNQSPDHQ